MNYDHEGPSKHKYDCIIFMNKTQRTKLALLQLMHFGNIHVEQMSKNMYMLLEDRLFKNTTI